MKNETTIEPQLSPEVETCTACQRQIPAFEDHFIHLNPGQVWPHDQAPVCARCQDTFDHPTILLHLRPGVTSPRAWTCFHCGERIERGDRHTLLDTATRQRRCCTPCWQDFTFDFFKP